jgi:hypothetical protein
MGWTREKLTNDPKEAEAYLEWLKKSSEESAV